VLYNRLGISFTKLHEGDTKIHEEYYQKVITMNLSIILLLLLLVQPPGVDDHRLTVSVSGLKPLKGDLYIGLHSRPDYFQVPDSALMKAKIVVNEETEVIHFDEVPTGKYAIAIYHDENLNSILDVNEIGIPKEGYGFSIKKQVPGRPKFEEAAFDVSRNDTVEIITIYHNASGSK
jgi:uncharacterized protein (DUF2141 family)